MITSSMKKTKKILFLDSVHEKHLNSVKIKRIFEIKIFQVQAYLKGYIVTNLNRTSSIEFFALYQTMGGGRSVSMGGLCLEGGGLCLGVSVHGGPCPKGCLSGGLCTGGYLVQEGSLSDTCEIITLPQTTFGGGKNIFDIC